VIASSEPVPLKLLALDEDDLKVLSAHLQDAVMRIEDMAYLPAEQKFAAVLNRFDWVAAAEDGGKSLRRCRCALRFEKVRRVQVQKMTPGRSSGVAALLALTFEPTDAPSGHVIFHFCGGCALRLEVECIEAELKDLGAVWETASMPRHSVIETGEAGSGQPGQQFNKAS
jgi:hypothetical protein